MTNKKTYRWAIFFAVFFLASCAAAPPTEHSISGENSGLYYSGRDPKHSNRSLMRVRDVRLVVFDNVAAPSPDSLCLLDHTQINPGESVLDLGTGTGVQAIFAARNAQKVIAIDIDPTAIKNATFNIREHKLTEKIEVRIGDLFSPLSAEERFDVILFNLRYPTSGEGSPLWNVHQRFFAGVKNHLTPNGRIYYQFGFLQNLALVKKMLVKNQLYIAEKRFTASPNIDGAQFLTLEIRALPEKIIQ